MSGRLFDPMRPDKTFPFQFTDRTRQDVRATWDRLCPGWRDRKPGQRQTVVPINNQKQRAK